jgi:uncharacterized protein (DUF433 family)
MSLVIHNEPAPLTVEETGAIRVGNTRVLLDTVLTAYEMGATAEEIVWQYPSLQLADVYATLSYYLNHRTEIDAYLAARRTQAENLRSRYETEYSSQAGLRARLLARSE